MDVSTQIRTTPLVNHRASIGDLSRDTVAKIFERLGRGDVLAFSLVSKSTNKLSRFVTKVGVIDHQIGQIRLVARMQLQEFDGMFNRINEYEDEAEASAKSDLWVKMAHAVPALNIDERAARYIRIMGEVENQPSHLQVRALLVLEGASKMVPPIQAGEVADCYKKVSAKLAQTDRIRLEFAIGVRGISSQQCLGLLKSIAKKPAAERETALLDILPWLGELVAVPDLDRAIRDLANGLGDKQAPIVVLLIKTVIDALEILPSPVQWSFDVESVLTGVLLDLERLDKSSVRVGLRKIVVGLCGCPHKFGHDLVDQITRLSLRKIDGPGVWGPLVQLNLRQKKIMKYDQTRDRPLFRIVVEDLAALIVRYAKHASHKEESSFLDDAHDLAFQLPEYELRECLSALNNQ
jgi:hypothetical protein